MSITHDATAIRLGGVRPAGLVTSPDGSKIFVASPDGFLRSYDANTGATLSSARIGSQLGAIDIAPDGSFVVVTERVPAATNPQDPWWNSTTTVNVYKVDTRTGERTVFQHVAQGADWAFSDVAILSDGNAYLTQSLFPGWSGWTKLNKLDLSTGQFSLPLGDMSFYQDSSLTATDARDRLLIGQLGLSSAQLNVYEPGIGLVASNGMYDNGVYGYAAGVEAISDAGNMIALYSGGTLHVYNSLLQYVANVSAKLPGIRSVEALAFSSDGDNLYIVDGVADTIVQVSTADWSIVQSFRLPEDVAFMPSAWGSELTVGPNGDYFLLMTSNGLLRVDNPTQANIVTGSSEADALTGTAGDDAIRGLAGDDSLTGGLGADRLFGGEGFDTAFFGGPRSAYRLIMQDGGRVLVDGPDGADSLEGIEKLVFSGPEGFESVSAPTTFFENEATLVSRTFGASLEAGSWTQSAVYPRMTGDVNGDGRADLLGFGGAGVYVALANGAGGFDPANLASTTFGASERAGGWTSADAYPRAVADINGDGRDDLVGFGGAGVYAALATGNGQFGAVFLAKNVFGADLGAGGWTSAKAYPRLLGDINGDGMADLVGFGGAGVYAALAVGAGKFGDVHLAINAFGSDRASGGWSDNDAYPRLLADINGDGMDDLIGFGAIGTYAALATGGGAFGNVFLALNSFGAEAEGGGWTGQSRFPRHAADVNGDGSADLVGFGGAGAFVALGQQDGRFTAPVLDVALMGRNDAAGGWINDDRFPRMLADTNGDNRADLIGFGNAGVYVSTASDFFAVG